jgi:DedD protein
MANQISNGNTATTEPPDLKRKLALRMTFAGLMIVALLATLAVFDRLNAPDEPEVQTPRFTEPVPVPKKEITQPVKPAEAPADLAKNEPKTAEPEASAAPVDKSQPPVEAPSRPEVLAQPVLPRTAPSQATPQSAAAPPATPARAPEARPATEPVAPAPAREPGLSARQPAPPRLFSGYALQAGVFSDAHLAEELHAKLTLNGIPSTLETRVQVGPFKSREEADAARAKMKDLGIDALMLTPSKAAARR